ncbi:MAG: DUF2284 domain-containing protein [Selenomonadaceae bacterium]|nr:DUF2284 domain-containing protein [Selenomonadaceae bacterium]
MDVLEYLYKISANAVGVFILPKDVVFEENVKMNCYYCSKYNSNWRCPPNIPDIDYEKMFSEFDKGLLIKLEYQVKTYDSFSDLRRVSSNTLHKTLLMLEKWLWERGKSNAISFGAGSCKLCKDGCGKDKCKNPGLSRCSLEAVGVHVVKTCAMANIPIYFPPTDVLARVGLVMWQD